MPRENFFMPREKFFMSVMSERHENIFVGDDGVTKIFFICRVKIFFIPREKISERVPTSSASQLDRVPT